MLTYTLLQIIGPPESPLANPSVLFGELGAYHVMKIKSWTPNFFTLTAKLRLLRSFLQNIWGDVNHLQFDPNQPHDI